MPDPIEKPTTDEIKLSQETPNATAHNAEIAVKLASQDAAGHSMAGKESDSLDGMAALDKLRDAKKAEAEKAVADKEEVAVEPAAKTVVKADEKPTPKADDSAAPPAAPGPTTTDIFAGIELPPHAKPKSVEAWTKLKLQASQEIAARDQKLAEAEKRTKELEEKVAQGAALPDEVTKELEELRAFRAKLDVDLDPKFNSFDKQVAETHEFIYSQLRQNGVIGEEGIEKMRKLGGPDPSKVNMDTIFEAMKDPALQRRIEAKMADVEMLRYQKEQAIKSTKDNVGQYMKEREEAFQKATTHHNDATKQHLDRYMGKFDYFKPKTVDPKADDATKKEVEADNAFLKDLHSQVQGALRDDSPEMRAIQIAGLAQLIYLQKVHDKLLVTQKTEKEAADKSIKELTAKLERLTKASVTRLQDSAAPTDGKGIPAKKVEDFSKPAAQSLDEIRADIIAKRAAAA